MTIFDIKAFEIPYSLCQRPGVTDQDPLTYPICVGFAGV